MDASNVGCSLPVLPVLTLGKKQTWKYETDEFTGVCEIAMDTMTVKVVFECCTTQFLDVLEMNKVIRERLRVPVSVERLAEQLSSDFPAMNVTVSGRAASHGWITSAVARRFS